MGVCLASLADLTPFCFNLLLLHQGMEFYGPEGPYNLFTGKDASRALAKMSFKPEDLAGGIDDLSQSEKDILYDWEQKFKMKYKYVGDIVD